MHGGADNIAMWQATKLLMQHTLSQCHQKNYHELQSVLTIIIIIRNMKTSNSLPIPL